MMKILMSGAIGAILGSVFGAVITGFLAYCVAKFQIVQQVKNNLKDTLFIGMQIINQISLLDVVNRDKAWEFNESILKFQTELKFFIEDAEYSYIKFDLLRLIPFIKKLHSEVLDFKNEIITSAPPDSIQSCLSKEFEQNVEYFNKRKNEYLDLNVFIIDKINKHTSFFAVVNRCGGELSKIE